MTSQELGKRFERLGQVLQDQSHSIEELTAAAAACGLRVNIALTEGDPVGGERSEGESHD